MHLNRQGPSQSTSRFRHTEEVLFQEHQTATSRTLVSLRFSQNAIKNTSDLCEETELAGYKASKRVVFVSQIQRAPNGKADYKTARDLAIAGL
jgi:acyl-CoA synthetase (AMP-forming)/AMP-acid ligase II